MKQILLTGATGVLGSEILRIYAPHHHVHLPIRAKNANHLVQRAEDLILKLGLDEHRDHLHFYAGDMSRERFGLGEEIYNSLLEKVEHFVHCAGEVRLNQTLEEARRNNLSPVKYILDFHAKSSTIYPCKPKCQLSPCPGS